MPTFSTAAQFVVGTLHVATIPGAMARRKVSEPPLRMVRSDFEPPALNEMLRWPRRLDGDPTSTWIRGLVIDVAREVFGPIDEALWRSVGLRQPPRRASRL